MSRFLFALSLGIGGIFWIAQSVQAQTANCAERARIVDQLQSRFGEQRQGMGMQGTDAIIEIFVSSETRTWSILLTRPSGISCLVAAGQSWDDGAAAISNDPGA